MDSREGWRADGGHFNCSLFGRDISFSESQEQRGGQGGSANIPRAGPPRGELRSPARHPPPPLRPLGQQPACRWTVAGNRKRARREETGGQRTPHSRDVSSGQLAMHRAWGSEPWAPEASPPVLQRWRERPVEALLRRVWQVGVPHSPE